MCLPELAGRSAHHFLNTLLHLPGALVGKRQGQYMPGRDALLQQVGNPVGKHTRFAGPGAGYHQHGAVDGCYGLSLYRVQFVEE